MKKVWSGQPYHEAA